jgi:putative ABC transport system substrate-binding protein
VNASRRALLVGSLTGLFGPHVGRAQPTSRVARVGLLGPTTAEAFAYAIDVFREELRARGWLEGQNLSLEVRFAAGRYERLSALAGELVALNVDVVVAMSQPAINAAKRATTRIPIVIETLGDALATGLVTNLARPGGNITGVSGFSPELGGKRLELIRELLPKAVRIGFLGNPSNLATSTVVRATQTVARQMSLQLHIVEVRTPTELDAAFEAVLRARSEALLVGTDPMLFSQRERLVELAARHRLPAVYENRRLVDVGGLASYGPEPTERFRQAADYVDRILKGARPGDLPIQRPTIFELVLNLKTAKHLGLTIPPTLRLRADHVVE